MCCVFVNRKLTCVDMCATWVHNFSKSVCQNCVFSPNSIKNRSQFRVFNSPKTNFPFFFYQFHFVEQKIIIYRHIQPFKQLQRLWKLRIESKTLEKSQSFVKNNRFLKSCVSRVTQHVCTCVNMCIHNCVTCVLYLKNKVAK